MIGAVWRRSKARPGLIRLVSLSLTLTLASPSRLLALECLSEIAANSEIGSVSDIQDVGGRVLIGSSLGLYELNGTTLSPIAIQQSKEGVDVIQVVDGRTLVGTDDGLFELNGTALIPLSSNPSISFVRSIQKVNGRILIASTTGFMSSTKHSSLFPLACRLVPCTIAAFMTSGAS